MSKLYSLSREDALRFLAETLRIQDAASLLQRDQRALLDTIMQQWMQRIPFHTLKQLATETPERRAPTAREATEDVISGVGGLCGTHGVGAYYILSALGYHCHLAISTIMGRANNHVAVYVTDVETDGDLFVLPLGTGYPTFAAVQLKSKNGYIDDTGPITDSFLTYRYVRGGADMYRRYHLTRNKADSHGRKYPNYLDDVWGEYYKIWIKPVTVELIQDELNKNVYENMEDKFNRIILICKYPALSYIGVRQGCLLREGEGGGLQSAEQEGVAALQQLIKLHFPEIPSGVIEKALEYWAHLQNT